MMEELKIGRAVQANPYVIQMDRFVQSLEKLTKVFLQLERKHDLFTKAEMEEMYEKVYRQELWLDADEMLRLGIVDEII